jgi:rod shape-determining protein MreC
VILSADYERLEFLRVLRSHELTPITDAGALIAPPPTRVEPDAETGEGSTAATDPSAAGGTGDVTDGSPQPVASDG